MNEIVGIVTALRSEASCITPLRLPYNRMLRLGPNTRLWLSGIGSDAARGAAKGLQAGGVDALVSFGVAAALDSQLYPGDLVLPEFIYYEKTLPVTLDWLDRLKQHLPKDLTIVGGTLATSSEPLTSREAKLELGAATGACAADLESGAIAEVAAEFDIPFIAIRAIIDPVEFSPPDALLDAVYQDGSVDYIHLLTLLFKRSVRLKTLFHLGMAMHAARSTLLAVAKNSEAELGKVIYR